LSLRERDDSGRESFHQATVDLYRKLAGAVATHLDDRAGL
jgi:hypothetical protein